MPCVLVVNDDPVQLHLIASLLESDGLDVCRCQSAESAIRMLCEHPEIDALIVDLHMPGIDGWRLCRLLRSPEYQAFNSLPILVMSATFSGTDTEQITTDLGANGFLALPADPSQVRACVNQVLHGAISPSAVRVLLIEGQESGNEDLSNTLNGQGWIVHQVTHEEEGYRLFHQLDPDIVLIDQSGTPYGGLDLLPLIKTPGSGAIAVLLSDDADPKIALQAIRLGADAYIRKPFDPEYVVALCEKARRERALLRIEELLEERTAHLRDSEARFRTLLEGLTDIVFVYDNHGVIRHINGMGAHLLDWSPSELVGQPISLIGATAADRWPGSSSSPSTAFAPQEHLYIARHGRRIAVEVIERSIVFEGQRKTLVVARDIGPRKEAEREKSKLERQLQQAQKMEAIGRLAGGVAHDVNNILTAILGHASLLSHQGMSASSLRQPCQVIEEAARRGQHLTAQLLGFARQGKHQDVTVDLHSTVQEVLRLLDQQSNDRLAVDQELLAAQPWVQGDPGQLHQIVLNLVLNAKDAMPNGGTLTVRTGLKTFDAESCQDYPGLRAGSYVWVSVTDTGCGISPEVQAHIFEPFFTTKEPGKGSGMGLAMVYGIVKNHGGYIAVSSQVEEGTTMTVYLPGVESPPQSFPEGPVHHSTGQGRILIIDDEEMVARTAEDILRYLGYDVVVINKGQKAVQYFKKAWPTIDLIILDCIMPDIHGHECFQLLTAIHPDVKILLCSGYDSNNQTQELLENGLAGFVQKPFDVAGLSQAVEEVLGKKRTKEAKKSGRVPNVPTRSFQS